MYWKLSLLGISFAILASCRADAPQNGAHGQFIGTLFADKNDKHIFAVPENSEYYENEEMMSQRLSSTLDRKTRIFVVANKYGRAASESENCAGEKSNAYGHRLLALPEGFYSRSFGGHCYIRVSPEGHYESSKFMWVRSHQIEEVGTLD